MFLACAGRCSLSPCVRVVPGVFGGRTARAGVVACCWARAWCEATRVGVACLLRPPPFFGSCAGARIAFAVGRVACTLFGSALTGCASGGVFGVCGFRSPARAPCLSVR